MAKNDVILERSKQYNSSARLNKKSNQRNFRFGINLNLLNETYQNLIKNRKVIRRFADDDRILKILFNCIDQENDHRSYDKIFYIRELDSFVMQRNLYKLNNTFFWKCSFCESDIELDNNKKFNATSFLCNYCRLDYNSKIVDPRIVDNFKNFTLDINTRLNNKYNLLLKKIQKNNKS